MAASQPKSVQSAFPLITNRPYSNMQAHQIIKFDKHRAFAQDDAIAVEEPLEIQLVSGSGKDRKRSSLAITMRTPGADWELSMGFLFTEGIIPNRAAIIDWQYPNRLGKSAMNNVIEIHLDPALDIDLQRLERHFYTSSSCGVCGKTSIDMVTQHINFLLSSSSPKLNPDLFYSMPDQLRSKQAHFSQTGGIHGAGLFNHQGKCLLCFEDVGRHNAMDKLIGAALLQEELPLAEKIVLVSGRASFELVQKALMAGIPVMAAVGAPSSLAIELAKAHGMTLIGFLKAGSFNVYTGKQRFTPFLS